MRTIIALTIALIAPAGCVDAPLTPAHLDSDGPLHGARMEQGAFHAEAAHAPALEAVQRAAVLAPEAVGPLTDAAAFAPEVGEIFLHIRADRLTHSRPVTYVWTHGDTREVVEGVLAPSTTLAMATSHRIDPAAVGPWKVEVFGEPLADGSRPVLFERDFAVTPIQ